MIPIKINDQDFEVQEGRSILEACREFGFTIPSLCYHPALDAFGACRLCVVEVKQPPRPPRLMASCVTPCAAGMHIQTQSLEVQKSRRLTAELLLGEAQGNAEIEKLAHELGVEEARYQCQEPNDCILCELCVRACEQIVGVSAISTIYRGSGKKVSPPFQIESKVCIACGTCVLICPTSAINLNDIAGYDRSVSWKDNGGGEQSFSMSAETVWQKGNGKHG